MDINKIKENKLKYILHFSVPSIIAMLFQTVITVTDAYFVGNNVGENALAAINLGLPVLYLFLGIGLCVGVGGSVISGRMLGQRDNKKASLVFSYTLVISFVLCIILSILVLFLFKPLLNVLRAGGELSLYFRDYYQTMLMTYPLMVLGTVLGMFIRTDGKPEIYMSVSFVGCIINAATDYLFVSVLYMGVRGSAIASLMVQIITVAIELIYFMNPQRSMRFVRFNFDKDINREIFINGSSEFIGEMSGAISMFAFNYVLMKYAGGQGVAAFTILGFAVYGFSMIILGFGQGIIPLVSILWGADEKCAAMEIRVITNKIVFVSGVFFALIFGIFGNSYASIFGSGETVSAMVLSGFRIYVLTFMTMGFNVIASMYFSGCGDALSSAIISALRGLVLLLLFVFILPALWGMMGIWLIAPVTEVLTAVVSLFLIKRQKRLDKGR